MADETLRVIEGLAVGTTFPTEGELLFGRGVQGPGSLGRDQELSRQHARVTRAQNGQLLVEDLDSTNGTYLNGWQIPSVQVLASGDKLQLGGTVLELVGPRGDVRPPPMPSSPPPPSPA